MTTDTAPAYLTPYLSAADRHGAGFSALLWASPQTQSVRFAALTRLVGLNGKSLLDVGCGRADLLDFLLARGIRPAHYVGLEGVDALADAAEAKRHADAMIVRADFVREPLRLFVGADVVYFSGSLNTLDPASFYATIRKAYDAAAETLVFNFLCSTELAGVTYLHWHEPGEVWAFCKALTPQVRRLDDYLRGDTTFALTKPQEHRERMTGRIDVHAHLLPDVDDGCKTYGDAIACARELVAAGYTHAFCTPHVWPSLNYVTRQNVPVWTRQLQEKLDEEGVALRVMPGGELNLHEGVRGLIDDFLITYAMAGRYVLVDMWANELPEFFEPTVRWLQSRGYTVILAHPERMRAVQDDPKLADRFAEMGMLLQGNLQCFGDPPDAHTRRVAEQYLLEGRYFLLGSDTHNPQSMAIRMNGLRNAIALAGESVVAKLTVQNPRELLPK